MSIAGHADSCGIFYRAESIIKVLDELDVIKAALWSGLVNDESNRNLHNLAKLMTRELN
ncbi:MAG: hypothetical protein JSW07_11930 [bacterium]|nr:MAG: hypothetical protein JSW07_11930 [bacterium]